MTGIALDSPDPAADHAELRDKGADADAHLMGGDGTVPLLFFTQGHQGCGHAHVSTRPAQRPGMAVPRPRGSAGAPPGGGGQSSM